MRRDEAEAELAAFAAARERWLAAAVPELVARSVWLVGSLGRGDGDAWSDVDLLVVLDDPGDGALPPGALLAVDAPHNGPVGGGSVGLTYAAGGLPLQVDAYRWPAGTPVPAGARRLRGTGTPGDLDLGGVLDLAGRGAPGAAPDPDAVALSMVPRVAKYLARGDRDRAAGAAAVLGLPAGPGLGAALAARLDRVTGHDAVRRLVAHHLDLARTLAADAAT